MEISINGEGFRFVMSWGFMVITTMIVIGLAMLTGAGKYHDDGRMK